jgi:hypothetical protein
MQSLGKSTWGVSLIQARNIYQATILPLFLSCSSVWQTSRHKQAATTIEQIQKQAALNMSGAYKATAAEALNTELHLMPANLKLADEAYRALIRINSSPQGRKITEQQGNMVSAKSSSLEWHLGSFAANCETPIADMEQKRGFVVAPWSRTLNITPFNIPSCRQVPYKP